MVSYIQQNTWGWMIAAYLFLGGLGGAVGAIGIGVDLFVQHRRRLGIFAALSGFGFLAVGTVLLLADLLQPLKAVFFFMNPRSWIFWGIMVISGFMVTSIIYVMPYIKDWPLVNRVAPYLSFLDRWQRWAGTIGVLTGFGVTAYTGFLISAVPAIAFWHTAGLPVLFTFSAFSTGSAYLMFALWTLRRSQEPLIEALERVDAALIVGEIIVLVAFFNAASCCPAGASHSLQYLLGNIGFLVGFVFLGLLVPLAGELYSIAIGDHLKGHGISVYLLPVLSLLVLIGGYLLRQYVLMAGMYSYPW